MRKDIFNDILSPSQGAEVSIIPVMQGDGLMKINENDLPDSLPILALRNAVLFPGSVYPITIGREKSIRLIEDAERNNAFIGAVPQNDLAVEDPHEQDLYNFGTVAKIVKTLEMPDGTITAILQGFKRFQIDSIVEYEPYMLGRVHYLDDFAPENDNKTRMIAESLKEKATSLVRMSHMVMREAAAAIKNIDSFEFLVNFIATTIEVENFMDKVELLQFGDLRARAMKLLSVLDTQLELQKIKQEINQRSRRKSTSSRGNITSTISSRPFRKSWEWMMWRSLHSFALVRKKNSGHLRCSRFSRRKWQSSRDIIRALLTTASSTTISSSCWTSHGVRFRMTIST